MTCYQSDDEAKDLQQLCKPTSTSFYSRSRDRNIEKKGEEELATRLGYFDAVGVI
jgi:hypothetical protein